MAGSWTGYGDEIIKKDKGVSKKGYIY